MYALTVPWHRILGHDFSQAEAPREDAETTPSDNGTEILLPQVIETPIQDLVPGGDLMIRVKAHSSICQYRVASQVLWAASPYFRTSFGPDSRWNMAAELKRASVPGEPAAQLELNEDDHFAIHIVLLILSF